MPSPAPSSSWWDRWFKRQPASRPSRPQSRPSGRQVRRSSTPATSGGQSSQPSEQPAHTLPAASCPTIVIQNASSTESQHQDPTGDLGVAGASVPIGTTSPVVPGTNRSTTARPTGVELPDNGGVTSEETEAEDALESHMQPSQYQTAPSDKCSSPAIGELERANRVVPEPKSTNDGSAEELKSSSSEHIDVDKIKTEIEDVAATFQNIQKFQYQAKEQKKISELKMEGQKLLNLWRDALDKRDVLTQIIQECTDATK